MCVHSYQCIFFWRVFLWWHHSLGFGDSLPLLLLAVTSLILNLSISLKFVFPFLLSFLLLLVFFTHIHLFFLELKLNWLFGSSDRSCSSYYAALQVCKPTFCPFTLSSKAASKQTLYSLPNKTSSSMTLKEQNKYSSDSMQDTALKKGGNSMHETVCKKLYSRKRSQETGLKKQFSRDSTQEVVDRKQN